MQKNFVNRILQIASGGSEFKKNLIALMSGVAIAQAIPILCMPVLSRLFTPGDFGLYANFSAIVAFLGVIITGKYELAIILPKRDREAINVLSLSCVLAVFFTLLFSLIFLSFGSSIAGLLNSDRLSPYMWFIPICALLYVIFLIFNEWCIRKKWFAILGKNKISNTAGIAGTSILFGLTKLQPGLILGDILGRIFSVGLAIVRVLKRDRHLFAHVTVNKMKYFAKRYINFTKFIVPSQLLDTLGLQMPIFVISAQFGVYETGLYLMSQRVLGIPITFFVRSVSDVFKQRATQDYQTHGNCINIYKKTIFSCFKIALIPFMVLFLTAPDLFKFVLGAEWYDAGVYTRYLCVWYMMLFIDQSVSTMIIVAEKQRLGLIVRMLSVAAIAISLFIGVMLRDIKLTLLILCVSISIVCLVSIAISYKLAKGNSK